MPRSFTRRRILQTALAACAPVSSRAAGRKTNTVMFMGDDLGAWAIGVYGCSDAQTPNIDRLAAGGVRFTRAFACTPVCSPARMTYFTGKIPSQHGVQDWLLPVDSFGPRTRRWLAGHLTFSEVLARNGYTLGMCGKWHMGDDEHPQAGFSYWATVPGGGGRYRDPEFVKNGVRATIKGFKTDIVGDCALEFLEQNKDRPFFLYVPFYAPHTPFDYQPEDYRKWHAQSKFSCFPEVPQHPWHNPLPEFDRYRNREGRHSYSALITGLDFNVGRILGRLEELGLRENTLVIFTSDQGWNAGHHGVWGKGEGTVPFNMLEESIRVPLVWNHPGRIRAGQVLTPMVSNYDFFPTLLDYLGVTAPRDPRRLGRSYAPFLRGQTVRWENRLYFEHCYVRGVRTENWKYIERTKEWPRELYNLESDPGETQNLIDDPAHRKQLSSLRADLDSFFRRAQAPPLEQWRSTTQQQLASYRK